MRFDVLSLFPDIFSGYVGQSLLKKAIDRGLISVHLHDIRDWTNDKHRTVDDRPFGGGPGMLLKVGPVVECVEAVQQSDPVPGHLVLLTPAGRRLDQRMVEELATHDRLVLLCGRYEGVDQRVVDILRPDEVSVGDFILNGGEVAAMAVIDATIRLLPGVLGDEQSHAEDSFSPGNRLLEWAQYTRPREYRGYQVPEVLLSGDHGAIARWRKEQSYLRTSRQRGDLLKKENRSTPGPPGIDTNQETEETDIS
jgi:tRNA (guanine37-N1)-methyltransferase